MYTLCSASMYFGVIFVAIGLTFRSDVRKFGKLIINFLSFYIRLFIGYPREQLEIRTEQTVESKSATL